MAAVNPRNRGGVRGGSHGGVALTDEQRKELSDAAHETYQQCGFDLGWGDRTPTKSEFVDVICDLIHTRLTPTQEQLWNALTRSQRYQLVRKVGP